MRKTMAQREKTTHKKKNCTTTPSSARLDRMIEEAIVDAYGEFEQITGFYTMLDDNLAVPFVTEMLGVEVTVERIDMTDNEQIVAICARGKARQRVPILDLPLPDPPRRIGVGRRLSPLGSREIAMACQHTDRDKLRF
jgi:hypothetical protein